MNDNDMPEKSDIQLNYYKFGVNIPVPTIRLSDQASMLRLCVV